MEGNKEHINTCKTYIGYSSPVPLPGAFHPLCLEATCRALVRFYKDAVASACSKIVLVSVQVVRILRILHLHFFSKIQLAGWLSSNGFVQSTEGHQIALYLCGWRQTTVLNKIR